MAIVRLAAADRITALDSLDALLNGGTIQIRSGAPPANPEAAASGTLLATLTIPADAFAGAAGSAGANVTKALLGVPLTVAAAATGTAGYASFITSGAAVRLVGDVTATGGGGMIELNSTSITSGANVSLTAFTLSIAAG